MSEVQKKDSWQPVVFGASVALTVGAISVAAILTYDDVDDTLKIWAALSGLVGILIGAGAAYFPTVTAVRSSEAMAEQARKASDLATRREQDARMESQFWTKVATRLAGELDEKRWDAILNDLPDLKSLRRT